MDRHLPFHSHAWRSKVSFDTNRFFKLPSFEILNKGYKVAEKLGYYTRDQRSTFALAFQRATDQGLSEGDAVQKGIDAVARRAR